LPRISTTECIFLALCLSAAQGLAALILIVLAVIVSRRMTVAREAALEKVHLLAYYDPLTGLANRALLRERLSACLSAAGQPTRRPPCCTSTWTASDH